MGEREMRIVEWRMRERENENLRMENGEWGMAMPHSQEVQYGYCVPEMFTCTCNEPTVGGLHD